MVNTEQQQQQQQNTNLLSIEKESHLFHQCVSSDPDLLALGFVLNNDFIRLWILLLLFLLFRKHWRIPVQLHLSLQLVCTGLADTIWTHKHQKTMNKQCVCTSVFVKCQLGTKLVTRMRPTSRCRAALAPVVYIIKFSSSECNRNCLLL